jgi:tRNA(adenine34) deaminase
MIESFDDNYFMRQALLQAEFALENGEVPVGAIIVTNQKIIARAFNRTEQLTDFTAHAEMQAYTSASNYLDSKFLNECTLYVTLEPCLMCAGAAFWTRIPRIVFGAFDRKYGFSRLSKHVLLGKVEIKEGVLALECEQLLHRFFARKR